MSCADFFLFTFEPEGEAVFVEVGVVLYTHEPVGSFVLACVNHATLGVHGITV